MGMFAMWAREALNSCPGTMDVMRKVSRSYHRDEASDVARETWVLAKVDIDHRFEDRLRVNAPTLIEGACALYPTLEIELGHPDDELVRRWRVGRQGSVSSSPQQQRAI